MSWPATSTKTPAPTRPFFTSADGRVGEETDASLVVQRVVHAVAERELRVAGKRGMYRGPLDLSHGEDDVALIVLRNPLRTTH